MSPSFRCIFWSISVIILLVGIPSSLVIVEGQDLTRIEMYGAITEGLDDPDTDDLHDHLVICLSVKVLEPGSYGVHGNIGNGAVNANWGPEDLSLGIWEIELFFSGGQISQYGRNGRYQINIEVYSKDLQMDPLTLVYTTSEEYDSSEFETPQGSTGTFVFARGDSVFIQGETMTVSVNQTFPELTFSYSDLFARSVSETSLVYERLIAYDDLNGDGRWDQGTDEMVYEGDLTTVDWELDLDINVGYDITLSGILQMRRVDTATVAGWARISFSLGSDQLLSSGNIQKFDIDIELWQPLDGDRLALMHRLSDETGKQIITAGETDTSPSADPYSLNTIGQNDEIYGTYSWGEEIQVGLLDPDTFSNATTWFSIDTQGADIWFSYPIDDDIQMIHHDPKVGMKPDNVPIPLEETDTLDNDLWIMLAGTFFGIILIGLTIFIQVRKRRPGGGV